MIYIVINLSSEIIPNHIPIRRFGIFAKEKREISLTFNRVSNNCQNCFARQASTIYRLTAFKGFLFNDCP
jgi:hypothetical protein